MSTDPAFLLTAAVVLYHSDLDHLRATLRSFFKAVPEGMRAQIYVVDQSCEPIYSAAARGICEQMPSNRETVAIEFIDLGRNGGYGAGHNVALERGLGQVHLILNPDVELGPNALVSGLAVLVDDPNIVLVAPRAINDGGEEDYLAKGHPSVLVLVLRAFGPAWLKKRFSGLLGRYELRELPTSGSPSDIYLASGCCMLVRGSALRAVGGFDERYFLYFEDYDLTRRLALEGRIVRDHAMHIVHHGGNAARKGMRHILWFGRGAWRFLTRWGWRWIDVSS